MIIELFSVWDGAANRYMDVFPAPTVDFAIRGFKEACQTEGHQFQKFPEDYVLFHVGQFDGESGEVGSVVIHKIAQALSYTFSAEFQDNLDINALRHSVEVVD